MKTPTLVVSDPPHGDVDLGAAAELLSLDLAGTRLKVQFPAPEVLAASDTAEAEAFAASLRETGLCVTVLDGRKLVGLPWPRPASSVAFDERGLTAELRGALVHVPYDQPLVAIHCKPPRGFSMKSEVDAASVVERGDGPAVAEAIQWTEILDLYYRDAGELHRLSIVPELADLSGVNGQGSSAAGTMGRLVDAFHERFTHLHYDGRLRDVRPRARFVMGEAGFNPDQRKRYSFGTLLLCHILDQISAELRDVPQYELGSRLAYALNRQKTG